MRKDKICWKNVADLNREKERGLQKLFTKLGSLPFELNKKCNLMVQGSIACFCFSLCHFLNMFLFLFL